MTRKISILQIGVEEEYSSLRDFCIRQSDSFILVCSVSDSCTAKGLHFCYESILKVKKKKAPMVVALNKIDLKADFTVHQLHSWCPWIKQNDIPVFETSAKSEQLFTQAVCEIGKCRKENSSKQEASKSFCSLQ